MGPDLLEEGDREQLRLLDRAIRDRMRDLARAGDEFIRMLNRRDVLRQALRDARHPPDPERRLYLEESLVRVEATVAKYERDLTDWAEQIASLVAAERRLQEKVARQQALL